MPLRLRQLVLCLASVLATAAALPGAESTLTVELSAGVRLELVLVKAGTFHQGSPASEAGRSDDEALREVRLSRDFYAGRFEVTRGQFARFVQETGYRTEAEKGTSGGFGFDGQGLVQRKEFTWRNPGFPQTGEHPVVLVTYDDAQAFAAWLARKARRAVALPTEAQWEYAARGGTASRFYSGDSEDEARTIAWHKANAGSGTQPVGQKQPNRFGLYDTSGNAYEWCRDWYAPYAPGPLVDPEERRSTLSDKPRRVLRGGSWLKEARHGRSAARYRNTPGSRNADNGFRVVASLEETAAATAAGAAPAARGAIRRTPAPRATPAPGDGGSVWGVGLVCTLVSAVAFILAAIFLLRRAGGSPTSYPGIRASMGSDGFWLYPSSVEKGSKIRYCVMVDGAPQTGEVAAEGQRQFVYTGGRPSNLEVLGVSALAGAIAAGRTPQPRSAAARRDEPIEPTPPFRGYPSAY